MLIATEQPRSDAHTALSRLHHTQQKLPQKKLVLSLIVGADLEVVSAHRSVLQQEARLSCG